MEERTVAILQTLQYHLGLIEKQLGMVSDLVATAPALDRKEAFPALAPDTEIAFALVPRQQVDELLKNLTLEASYIRRGLEAALSPPGSSTLDLFMADSEP